jgi:hypothetical protein
LAFGKAEFEHNVLALDIAGLLQALSKSAQTFRKRRKGCRAEIPHHRHRRLLRARRERPRRRSAAEQRDEFATM